MNKFVTGLKNGLRKAVDFVDRNARKASAAVRDGWHGGAGRGGPGPD